MAENPKLGCDSPSLSLSFKLGFGEVGSKKMTISDQEEGFLPEDRKMGSDTDSFVVDIESLSHGSDKDVTANSRITLQRNLSRKGSQRGEKKTTSITTSTTSNERDTTASPTATEASFIGDSSVGTDCTFDNKLVTLPLGVSVGVGTTEPTNAQQDIITTTTTTAEIRCKRYGGRRSPWILNPRSVFLFFATLSSMGTIIIIYFTLSINRLNGDDNHQAQY